jgi:hypothetical protein
MENPVINGDLKEDVTHIQQEMKKVEKEPKLKQKHKEGLYMLVNEEERSRIDKEFFDSIVIAELSCVKLDEKEKISNLDFKPEDLNYFSYTFLK